MSAAAVMQNGQERAEGGEDPPRPRRVMNEGSGRKKAGTIHEDVAIENEGRRLMVTIRGGPVENGEKDRRGKADAEEGGTARTLEGNRPGNKHRAAGPSMKRTTSS